MDVMKFCYQMGRRKFIGGGEFVRARFCAMFEPVKFPSDQHMISEALRRAPFI
jgi:hypothetical protein